MRIGVTGHADLGQPAEQMVRQALAEALRPYAGPDLIGISCLCRGVDQIFARAVIEASGTLEVILPAADYRHSVVRDHEAEVFDQLIGKARRVRQAPFPSSGRPAFQAASEMLLRECDLLFAVWDGSPSRDLGDTADVIRTAQNSGVDVRVIWPECAVR
jgi:hypothetical protein